MPLSTPKRQFDPEDIPLQALIFAYERLTHEERREFFQCQTQQQKLWTLAMSAARQDDPCAA